ncbi:glycosyltransferase [Escherichia coli]|nr:glycosyltransferase [Escherichia coli]
MLKVLHLYKTYYPDTFGGVEQVIYQLSEVGVDYGIDSTVLVLSKQGDRDNTKIDNHHVYYAKTDFELSSTPFSLSIIRKFKKLARNADIIHYHFPYPYMDLLHFICNIKKPTVVSYHSDIVKQKRLFQLYYPLMRRFLNSVNCIVASSPNYAQTSKILQRYKSKVKIIPYGLKEVTDFNKDENFSNEWKKIISGDYFLFVGAFRYYKGLTYLLDAVKNTDIRLVIAGTGPLDIELRNKVINDSNVIFTGPVTEEQKYELISSCYSLVFPSNLRSESFGISLLEGAMYGKPLISCEIGTGTSFINIHKETGLVVPPPNSMALKEAMLTLINNKELAATYGNNAYHRYKSLFTADMMLEKYLEIYQSICA